MGVWPRYLLTSYTSAQDEEFKRYTILEKANTIQELFTDIKENSGLTQMDSLGVTNTDSLGGLLHDIEEDATYIIEQSSYISTDTKNLGKIRSWATKIINSCKKIKSLYHFKV
jgi:hypothetical protein